MLARSAAAKRLLTLLLVAGVGIGAMTIDSGATSPAAHLTVADPTASTPPAATPPAAAATVAAPRPNIVFILADDLSWNLVNSRFAPHLIQLEKQGETFTNYFVSDSLCCPSRSTIFTGLFPHDTKVITNVGATGGFRKFQSEHLDKRTFALAIRPRGYRTGMMGKYLNGYGQPAMTPAYAPIPPGWTDWRVAGNGYLEFNYALNENGTFNFYGGATGGCHVTGKPDNYGVDVLNARAQSFINAAHRQPFVLEVATFAPHSPYIPAPRNACDFPGLAEPRDPSFNAATTNAPAWLAHHDTNPLTSDQIATIDRSFRMRAQSVESIDKLIADVEATLERDHLAQNTYLVFSSDNGYHLGQHRLPKGKQTAFDTDIRVPLIISGPGVPRGKTIPQVAQNVDLYPTFVQLAGGKPSAPIDGHSLVSLLHPARTPPVWRTVALVEHHHTSDNPGDPDFEEGKHGANPTTYEAIRVVSPRLTGFKGRVDAVYVEYADKAHEIEYYDIAKDRFELDNIAGSLSPAQRAELHTILVQLERCHNATACWTAAHPG